VNGQQNLVAYFPFNRIHLCNGKVGMCLTKSKKILISFANTTGFVYLVIFLLFATGISDFSGHVNISCLKKVIIHKSVQSAFANHYRIRMVDTNVVQGLFFPEAEGKRCCRGVQFPFPRGKDRFLILKERSGIQSERLPACKDVFLKYMR